MALDDFPKKQAESPGAERVPQTDHAPKPVLVMIDCRNGNHILADADAPQLRVTDLGVTRCDGVFESMLARGGVPRKPQAHLQRLAASARATDLDVPADHVWLDAIAAGLRAHGMVEEALVKLVLSRGSEGGDACTAWVYVIDCTGQHDTMRMRGIDALLLERGYDSALHVRAPWLLMGAKTLSYSVNMAALRHARRQGADDVVFVSADGWILEGPTSTVVIARCDGDGIVLLTPPPECGILAGTTQAALFDASVRHGWRTECAMLTPDDLHSADGVWLVSSIRLQTPINRLNGRALARSDELNRRMLALILDAG